MSVYFARVGRYIKVGYSENPERRVRNLMKSATRYGLPADLRPDAPRELLAAIPGGLGVEWTCHESLDDFAAGGEFFIDEPPVRGFIAEAQAGRFPVVTRDGGPFVPVDLTTDEDRAALTRALNCMFTKPAGAVL